MFPASRQSDANPRKRLASVFLAALTVSVFGCGESESIARYSVPKEEKTPTAPARTSPSPVADPSASDAKAWFFKLEGPPEQVGAAASQFKDVVESIRFENGRPTWSLPESWSETSGSGMRFATLTIEGADPPLEVSVIPLPVFGEQQEYLKQNIDRWRGQIGLEPTSGSNWLETAKSAGEVQESSAGDVPVTFVDLRGKTEKFDPARMLGAVLIPDAESAASSSASAGPPAAATSGSSLTFETPDGWEPGRTSAMRAASFKVTDGDREVDISAMTAGGDELANVNRWRGQVGLQPISQAELDESAREIDVDGSTGRLFELVGEKETILAAIVPHDGRTWFFKLMGDPTLAEREKANFEAFVTSVKFPR